MTSPCPFCSAPIPLQQWLLAITPWRLICSTCQRVLRLKAWVLVVGVLYLLGATLAIGAVEFLYVTQRSLPRASIAITAVSATVVGLLLDTLVFATDPFVR